MVSGTPSTRTSKPRDSAHPYQGGTVEVSEQPLLEVAGLRTHFSSENGIVKAVDGVDFTIERGGILGMVGESGSGKSVTGLSILGLLGSRNAKISGGRSVFPGADPVAQ